MTGRCILLVTAAILGCVVVRAAEKMDKLEVKGSTELDLPKPKRNINTDRRLNDQPERPGDNITSIAPPRVENSPLVNKKLLHELDKQKNWIFKDPREDNFDSKTEEFMKGEKGSGLYNNRFMQSDDDRTAVQKFLERDRNREDKDKDKDKDRESDSIDRSREKEGFLSKHDEDDLKEKTGAPGEPKAQFDTAIFKAGAGADPFGGASFDKKLQRDPFGDSSLSAQRTRGFDKEEVRQQQIAHEKEFDSILQSRPGSAASFGRIDTLNPAADVGRLDLGTPGTARRSDPYSIGSRGGPTTATFTDGGAPSFGNRSDFSSRNFNDSLPSFGATQPIASFGASRAQVVPDRPSALPPAASVQAIPMRKF